MNTASESSKLVELRAKTDRQLVEMINNRLEAGLSWMRLAAQSGMRGCKSKADLLEAKGRHSYEEARLLSLFVRDIGKGERRDLEHRLEQLRGSIGELSQIDETPVRAAC